MNRRLFVAKLAGGIAGILASGQAPLLLAQSRPFIIGQSIPLTGTNAEFGLDIKAGVDAFLATSAKRGNGLKFLYKVLDDKNNPAEAAANTKKLIAEGCGVLFGYASATIALPSIPLAEAARIPIYAPFTGARTIHRSTSPVVYTARASYDAEAAKFSTVLQTFGVKRATVIHYDDPVGLENRDTCVEQLKTANIGCSSVAIKRNAAVAAEVTAKILASEPDVVLFTTLSKPSAELIQELRPKLKKYAYFVALSFVGSSQLQTLLGDDARGLVVSHVVPQPWKSSIELVKSYQDALRAAGSSRQPSFAGLEAYLALKGLEIALVKSSGTSGPAVGQALSALRTSFEGVTLDFTKDKHHGGSYVDYTVIRSKSSAS